MDATITTTQSQTSKKSVATIIPSLNRKSSPTESINGTNSLSLVNSITSLLSTSDVNSVKNKRKNFNPRCSSVTTVDGQYPITMPSTSPTLTRSSQQNNENEDRPKSTSLASNVIDNTSHHSSDLGLTHHESSTPPSPPPPSTILNQQNFQHQFKDFSSRSAIAEKWRGLLQTQEISLNDDDDDDEDDENDEDDEHDEDDDNSDTNHKLLSRSRHYSAMALASHFTDSEQNRINKQTKLEFANCNTFNAVQDLLNVYGLQISPLEIVEALRKQQQKFGDCEPPTPPRTPLSISLTTLLNNATAARGSYRNGVGGECGTESVPEINALSEFSVASSTAMTMATTSNANPNSRNNNNGECQFVDMATPISLIKLASISKLMPSNDNRANESNECMISPTNSEMKNKFKEINDDELGSSEDGQSRQYSKDHYRNQDQSKHQYNEDYGQKRIQNEKQDQYMHDQDDLDNNGDGFEHFGDDDSTNIYNFDGTLNEDSNMSAINDQPMSDDQTSGDELFSGSGSYVGGALDGPSGSGRSLSSSSVNLFDKCSLGLFSPLLQLPQMRNEERQLTAENTRNLSKFSSYVDCKNDQCKVENLREHYHCFDSPCFAKVLSKKEEIIRHLKWHKKRSESLNHGFLRFSSSDDCSATFGKHCTHNRKQTHYHCFQPNCDKIYISTSDVQMHSNYHRKDSAIFQEGFQRYRATEECKADYCVFAGQRTTHFHCRRDNCRFTFKNKADMEKHKSYHVKDKQLARDGFKKFLKNEPCPYTQCRFSRVCNHIHCVRENCYYVLHSSGQLLSHKRKHDRVDGEQAYCRYKMLQKKALTDDSNRGGGVDLSAAALLYSKNLEYSPTPGNFSSQASSMPLVKTNTIKAESDRSWTPKSSITSSAGGSVHSELGAVNKTKTSVSPNWKINNVGSSQAQLSLEFLTQMQQRHKEIMMRDQQSVLTAKGNGNNHCFSGNIDGNEDYGNMTAENENLITESAEGFLNSEKSLQELFSMIQQFFTDKCKKQILSPLKGSINKPTLFSSNEPLNLKSSSDHQKPLSFSPGNVEIEIDANVPNDLGCNYIECFINTDEQHLHCLVKDCEAIIPHNLTDIAAHLRMHEINRTAPTDGLLNNSNLMQITSIEGFFNRKRGRPPKNRVVEVYNNVQHSPQAIFTSFKLEKSSNTNTNTQENSHFHTSTQLYNTPSIANQRQQSNNSSSKYSTFEPNKSMKLTNIQTINAHQQHLPTEAKKSTITDSANNAHIQNERHFIMYEPNEKCDNYQQCPQYKNLHFHCTYGGSSNESSCRFVTKYGRAMDMHLHQFHMEQQPTPVASAAKLIIVDGDCGINDCGFRKIKTHYHCRMCIKGFLSPLEFQIHRCSISISDFAAVPYNLTTNSDKLSLNQTPSANSSFEQQTTDDEDLQLVVNTPKYSNHCTAGSERTSAGDGTSSVELNAVKSEHSEDERSVSVVRAAGTFYPQNSKTCSGFGSASKNISQQFQLLPTTITNSIEISTKNAQKNPLCQRPFCKLKRKIHGHCDFCNQGFSDLIKLKAHQLKHVSTKLCNYMDLSSSRSDKAQLLLNKKDSNNDAGSDDYSDHPQDLSCNLSQSQIKNLENCDQSFSTSSLHTAQSPKVMEVVDVNNSNNLLLSFNQSAAMPSLLSPMIATHHLPSLHLAHLANYYQQNPYNYHNFYSLLSGVAAAGLGCTTTPKTATGSNLTDLKFDLPPCGTDPSIRQHHLHLINFMNSHQDQQQSKAQSQQQQQQLEQNHHQQQLKQPQPQQQQHQQNQPQPQQQQLHSQSQQHHQQQHQLRCKRKETDGFSPLIESLPKQMRPSLSSSVSLSAIPDGLPPINVSGSSLSPASSYGLKTVANFKMFKDEPIPHGYLKFRFNEDCNFQNCGYRNHQSHFHCIRNDCYYSFCDKTRFVQHTARHERLDKLMGDDFKQYRANMRCGYDECAYNKNLGGPNNKSSHFHCLKCNFICSDTNKVVAHRRQHSKMEYIRMAGFRKVSNNEKCSTSMTPTTNVSSGCSGGYNDNVATIIPTTTTTGATTTEVAAPATSTPTPTSTITTATNITNNECSYCLKQTHYHCLVCDCSVLSRAQLGSHRHRV